MAFDIKATIFIGDKKKSVTSSATTLTIGRSTSDSIVINADQVSRSHLKVKVQNNSIKICDNKSTNGTFVNNIRIEPYAWVGINEKHEIRFGDGVCKLKLELLATELEENDILLPTPPQNPSNHHRTPPLITTTQQKEIPVDRESLDLEKRNELLNTLGVANQDDKDFIALRNAAIEKYESEAKFYALQLNQKAEQKAFDIVEIAKKSAQKIEDEFESKKNEKRQEILKIEEQINQLHHDHKLLKEKDRELNSVIENTKKQIDVLNSETSDKRSLLDRLYKDRQSLEQLLDHVTKEIQRSEAVIESKNSNIAELDKKIVFLMDEVSDLKNREKRTIESIEKNNLELRNYANEKKKREDELLEVSQKIMHAQLKLDEINNVIQSEKQLFQKIKDEAESTKLRSLEYANQIDKKSKDIIAESQKIAQDVIKNGQAELEQKKLVLNQELEKINNQIKNLDQTRIQIESEQFKLKDNLILEKKKVLAEALSEQERIVNAAKLEGQKLVDTAKAQCDDLLKQNEEKSLMLKKQLDQELELKKSEERDYLAKLRAKEVEQVRQLRQQEEDEIKRRKNENINEISDGIHKLVLLHLNKIKKEDLSLDSINQISEEIKQVVHESLIPENRKSDSILARLNPYGTQGKGKSLKKFKRVIIASGFSFALVILCLIFPAIYLIPLNTIKSWVTVEKTAQAIFLDKIQEERENRPRFSPTKISELKESYALSLIYTLNFFEKYQSEKFQKSWTVKAHEIMVNELGLSENVVVDFLRAESRLVEDLESRVKKISFENSENEIMEIQQFEKNELEKMHQTVKGELNFNYIYRGFKKHYETLE